MDRRFLGTVLAWLAIGMWTPGCTDSQEYLVIERTPSWTVEDSDRVPNLKVGVCLVDPTIDVSFLNGLLDVGFGDAYHMAVVLENRLLPIEGDSNPTGVPQGEVQLLDVDVELTMPQAPEIIEELRAIDESLVEFNQPIASLSIAPGDEQGLFIEVISEWTADELRPRIVEQFGPDATLDVVAKVVVNGRRSGSGDRSDDVSTREYRFPIEICNKCLVNCSYCGNSCPAGSNEDAENTDRVQGEWIGGVCGSAQDFLDMVPESCASQE